MVIFNHFGHYFAGKNSYFIVAKNFNAMVDSWFIIRYCKMANIITVAAATAEELESYLSNSNCIIESNESVTRVIGGHSLGDY